MIPFTMPLSMYGQQTGYGTSGTNKILSEFGKSMFNALTGGNYNQQNPSGVSLLGGVPKQPVAPMTDADKDRMMEELYPSQPRFDAVPPAEDVMPMQPQVIPPRIPSPNLNPSDTDIDFLLENNPNMTYEEAEKFLNQYGMSLI